MQDAQITILTAMPRDVGAAATIHALAATFEVVGGSESIDSVGASTIDLVPDVVIVHGAFGLEVIADLARAIVDNVPVTRMLLLTDIDDESTYEVVRNGGFAVVSARATPQQVIEAIRAAARRESIVTPRVASALLAEMSEIAVGSESALHRPPSLTLTEQEVLLLISRGKTPEEIANLHEVTARLVNLHVGYAVAKLQQHLSERRRLVNH